MVRIGLTDLTFLTHPKYSKQKHSHRIVKYIHDGSTDTNADLYFVRDPMTELVVLHWSAQRLVQLTKEKQKKKLNARWIPTKTCAIKKKREIKKGKRRKKRWFPIVNPSWAAPGWQPCLSWSETFLNTQTNCLVFSSSLGRGGLIQICRVDSKIDYWKRSAYQKWFWNGRIYCIMTNKLSLISSIHHKHKL